jgi:hypothetical protein
MPHDPYSMGHAASSSGQPVGFIQLTEEEALEMKKIPVMINILGQLNEANRLARGRCRMTHIQKTVGPRAGTQDHP